MGFCFLVTFFSRLCEQNKKKEFEGRRKFGLKEERGDEGRRKIKAG
jgi:hypothetical protein